MSKIAISDLRPTLSSDSYLNDLTEIEQNIEGGMYPMIPFFLAGFGAVAVGGTLGILAARALDKL